MAASALGVLTRLSELRNTSPFTTSASGPGRTVTPARTAVCSSSGAILPKPKKADPLRPLQDCSGSAALLVCGDSDQQEFCGTAGRARHLRARGRRRRRLKREGCEGPPGCQVTFFHL
ncbi:uncharacterized protein LOC130514508 isoform X1 [Takifugu flavidus]|uniref:uncharacterized protein LOC130514508 isoform X1 n=1 Tax=Takifugu flavidus TaxID=433684 RepID=UPI002544AFE6|nr:uncharacterized protein LOC130514508 isoform X1 [Takifugu flavidus]